MKHSVKRRTLGRPKAQRVALLRSLARSLVLHEAITTTVAKAKELRPFVEELVTASKVNTLASQRFVRSRFGNMDDAAKKLIVDIAPRYGARAGGYTRIVRLGRIGKRVAESARIEFVK
jgi:large subunit ribosomal protein L17